MKKKGHGQSALLYTLSPTPQKEVESINLFFNDGYAKSGVANTCNILRSIQAVLARHLLCSLRKETTPYLVIVVLAVPDVSDARCQIFSENVEST